MGADDLGRKEQERLKFLHELPNNSLDRSGGSVFRIKCGAAKAGW